MSFFLRSCEGVDIYCSIHVERRKAQLLTVLLSEIFPTVASDGDGSLCLLM